MREEIEWLKGIDDLELSRRINRSLEEEQIAPLSDLQLRLGGAFICTCLKRYEVALVEYRRSKSIEKRRRTFQLALRAAQSLESSVRQAKFRAQNDEKNDSLFFVDGEVTPPPDFADQLSVRINYRWREALEETWNYGSINFTHLVAAPSAPATGKAALRADRQRQGRLYAEWNELARIALFSVKEFFLEGGKGGAIPPTFRIVSDDGGSLNNFSAKFWEPI